MPQIFRLYLVESVTNSIFSLYNRMDTIATTIDAMKTHGISSSVAMLDCHRRAEVVNLVYVAHAAISCRLQCHHDVNHCLQCLPSAYGEHHRR